MSLFPSSRPALNLKIVPRIPANIYGSGFVTAAKSGVTYTLGADYRLLASIPTINDADGLDLVLQNRTLGSFVRASLTTALSAAIPSTAAGAFGLTLLGSGTQADARTSLALVPGADVQAFDADLASLASASGTNVIYYRASPGTWSPISLGSGLTFIAGELANVTGTADVVGPAGATDNAAARFDTTTGKLIQNSALIVADTTAALSRTGGGGIAVQGTNTNDNAAAGQVGEYISATLASGSAIALTSGVSVNVVSILLTAGDWNVAGNLQFNLGTAPTRIIGGVSTVSATLPTPPGGGYNVQSGGLTASDPNSLIVGMSRLSLSAPTTVYLVASATHGGGTNTAYGFIGARRAR